MVDPRHMLTEIADRQRAWLKTLFEQPPVIDDLDQDLTTYQAMMVDPTVSACIETIKTAILDQPPTIIAAPNGEHVAAEIELQLSRLDLENWLWISLNALWRGFNAQEITWEFDDRAQQFHLLELAELDAESTGFGLDAKDRLQSILYQPGGAERQEIPLGKVWLHRHKPSRLHPAGQSILQAAYRPYRAKDQLTKYWSLSCQRYGMPQIIGSAPAGTPQSVVDDFLKASRAIQLDGVAVVPDQIAYQIITPTYAQAVVFAEALHWMDAQIQAALLLQFKAGSILGPENVTEGAIVAQGGSTSQRILHIARELSQSFTNQVVRPLVAANWGPQASVELCPQLLIPEPPAPPNAPGDEQNVPGDE